MNNLLYVQTVIYRTTLVTRFLFVLIATAIVALLLLLNLAPMGVTTHAASAEGDIITDLGPDNRVTIEHINGQKIYHQKHNIAYFYTKMPFKFDTATVRLTFKNSNPDQVISLGYKDQEKWHYYTQLYDVPFLNTDSWIRTSTNPVLYQRKNTYSDVDAFLDKLPADELIGTYGIDTDLGNDVYTTIPDYSPQQAETVINTPLRGKQIIYAYLHNEPFHMAIEKQDLNWYEDPDVLSVKIYKGKTLVYETIADDDGIEDNSKIVLQSQEVTIDSPGPGFPENGVYKIIIDANNDMLIRKISTNLHKLVFQGSLFLAGNKNAYSTVIASTSATTVYTNALALSAMTYHKAGLQYLTVDKKYVRIPTVKNDVVITPKTDFTKIYIPKNDITLKGFQGYFSFNQDQFFLPTAYHIMPISGQDDSALVDYILTDYLPSKQIGEWQVQEREFNLRPAFLKDGELSWIIQSPKLEENNNEIIIKSIEITFHKQSWF